MFSFTRIRLFAGAAALLATLLPAGFVAAQTADARPVSTLVAIPPLAFPMGHRARIAVVQAFPGTPRFPVDVRFRDAYGNVLGRASGAAGGGLPLIAAVDRGTAPGPGPSLVVAELVFGRSPSGTAGPFTCPLHITFQTLERRVGADDVAASEAFGCTVDPCLGLSAAPPPGNRRFPYCTSSPSFAPAPEPAQ